MPQLDITTVVPQVLSFFSIFFIFWLIISVYILPSVAIILIYRIRFYRRLVTLILFSKETPNLYYQATINIHNKLIAANALPNFNKDISCTQIKVDSIVRLYQIELVLLSGSSK